MRTPFTQCTEPSPPQPPPQQKINNFNGVARDNHWLTPAPILLHTIILLNCFALILEEAFITKYLSGEGVGEGGMLYDVYRGRLFDHLHNTFRGAGVGECRVLVVII